MKASTRRELTRFLDRAMIGALLLLAMLLLGIQMARAGEIVPSIGVTRSVDNTDGDPRIFGGIAFRGSIVPMVKTEIGLAYRTESILDGLVDVHQWPVTASLWLTPIPTTYVGAGVGWYHSTLEFADAMLVPQSTNQDFGVHVGGGLMIPLAPMAAIDLHGRYIFMRGADEPALPAAWDPDYWSTSAGLAIRF